MARSANNTKQKLTDVARELIWSESYNAVSVDEICKKAGVQKGSFYHYFPSKAHLALETMDSCMEETQAVYDDIFSAARPPLERFQLMVKHVVDQQKEILAEQGHVCGCPFATLGSEIAAQDENIGKKIVNICARKTAYYEAALDDLIAEGLISKKTNAAVKADEIFSFIIGQLIMARIKNDLGFLEKNLESAVFNLIGIADVSSKDKKLTA